MAWYVVHVGQVPGIYRTWEDCSAQVSGYPGNCYKKYKTEAEAFRAYYGENFDYQPALDIDEKPLSIDMKIRRIATWPMKDVLISVMAIVIVFLI